ncbi:class I SAM-dependent methyltransferase [Enemella sp. A6]|uniref:class I SAM-dependent methyltransferase n=1 Tax=Enemella sp. A6 TaxID=3440152 RepID=UPI003EBE1D60
METADRPWNLNIHFDRLLSDLVDPGSRVLDVGCGDGFLSARLAESGCRVVGLDSDADVLDRARQRFGSHDIAWVHGDLLTCDLTDESFDAVLSNATLHHLPDTAEGLRRMKRLTRPGGRIGVVGFARNGLLDWPRSLVGALGMAIINRVRGQWTHTAPMVTELPLTYGEMRRLSQAVLPGRRFRKLWLGRYWLAYRKPVSDHAG